MEVPQNIQHQLNQLQQLQQQAQTVTVQKKNVDIQIQETESALDELKKTDANTEVFKTAGKLLIKVKHDEINDELEEKLETLKLREKTMARQEERVMKKLEEMQFSIQEAMQNQAQ
ncbi:Prefoldin subunit beta [Candidatus Methanobinarius endosymbioticus]|uniref:Prefoldin subunit beta n=1 Tax=Candidatus Methanobinarius endosymbioticus TaxID=2006182 RepID=A0A366MAS4_9EURY|nr:Prefoldin subunit beta [Candidatus Methanobinarius endosymbioticus]